MSFSADVKSELCKINIEKKHCAVAQCYGILLYCNTFSYDLIKIVTENRDFAGILRKLFKKAFKFDFDIFPSEDADDKKLVFVIDDPEKIHGIFDIYGYEYKNFLALHINLGLLEEPCCQQSFLRGAFLAGGSVTDPEKRYHLELVTNHYSVSREMFALLLEMAFDPKETSRSGNYITYFKQSEAIEDFLTTIGAQISAMAIMSAKIEKDMRNSVNRRVNCDTANVSKTVDAALHQISAIKRIDALMGIESLPQKLYETAMLRLQNPEMSLSELAEAASPPVTKSCLNHRLRRLIQISNGG